MPNTIRRDCPAIICGFFTSKLKGYRVFVGIAIGLLTIGTNIASLIAPAAGRLPTGREGKGMYGNGEDAPGAGGGG